MWRTEVTERLGIEVPVMVSPMAGGPTTAALVVAAGRAGALGSVAAGYLTPGRLRDEIRAVRAGTDRPFAVNLFALGPPVPDPAAVEVVVERIGPLRAELGLPPRPEVTAWGDDLAGQLEVVLEERPAVVSFTFGLLPEDAVDRLHAAGCLLMGTATTVAEAVALERSGSDLVCAQGAEAGAHRGTFLGPPASGLVGTMALVPQVCDAVDVPVVAAGGIMDGRGVVAALALGADAAQLGTAFLRCPEAGTAAAHREALAGADEASTAVTDRLTGRYARGVRNRLMEVMADLDVPPYPVTNALTSELRRAAAAAGRADLMSLWAGQGVAMATERPAADVVADLVAGAAAVVDRLAATRD
ncbi:MAG TPA: nitronate monooxygenase [Acidimicrobiales bacterium]|jgi:nitronate monooxygenase